jgi:hypothetical protein
LNKKSFLFVVVVLISTMATMAAKNTQAAPPAQATAQPTAPATVQPTSIPRTDDPLRLILATTTSTQDSGCWTIFCLTSKSSTTPPWM